MAKIHVTDRVGRRMEIDAREGEPLMVTLRELDDGVEAICGGLCSCATCHVFIGEAWLERLGPKEADEEELIEDLEFARSNSRLSCQVEITSGLEGLEVEVAPAE